MKTHIFIDFWNLQLSVNAVAGSAYRLDWQKISSWLVTQSANAVGHPLSFEGTHVYMSYSPNSRKDAGLRDFATNVLSRFLAFRYHWLNARRKAHQFAQIVTIL